MKYNLMAKLMPLIMNKIVFDYLKNDAVIIDFKFKKTFKTEYKKIVERTPTLAKNNTLLPDLYIGCYLIAFYKAFPQIITESRFEGMIDALCSSRMLIEAHKNENAFSEKNLKKRAEAAVQSETSDYEMDWKSSFVLSPDKKNFELTYTKCGLCELGKRENCFHLIKYMCKTDFVMFEYMGANLVRNHTLANGDSVCDFQVSRKDKKGI